MKIDLLELLVAAALTLAAGTGRAAERSGIDLNFLDKTAAPCDDFYQFSCGNWLAKNPIPGDQSRWGRMNELMEANRLILKDILEKDKGKIGDYYAACLDEKAIEKKGSAALAPELMRIDALKAAADLPQELAHLHSIGVGALFAFGSSQDYQNAEKMIAAFDQGGFSLPDRDYYLQDKFAEQRKGYVEHVKTMLALAGDDESAAADHAATVLKIETALAKAAMSRVDRREPANVHHKKSLGDLVSLHTDFDWERYLSAAQAPQFQSLDLVDPDFFKGLGSGLKNFPLSSWKTYLRWKLIHAQAGALSSAFVDADFDFFGRQLQGQKELKARWKRCAEQVDRGLGEALGKAYVEREFGAQGKERTLAMVRAIEAATKDDLETLPWMTPATKKAALKKLEAFTDKIGYPDRWRDYSKLDVVKGDALGNLNRAAAFEFRRDLAKIGQPVDKAEWEMTPPTVNAYYDPQMNNINFPAGILRPPFFDTSADPAAGFGAIGVVVGHEITHGFDDEGRHYDGAGNLRDWWTPEDAKAFEKRSQCLVDQYSGYSAVKDAKDPSKDVKINGKLTLGENTADNGGLRLSYMALEGMQSKRPRETLDGFTPEQRFFIAWGQAWCTNQTEQTSRLRAVTDPHSPPRFRVIGTLSNMPEFAAAFSCHAPAPMVNAHACRVW